MAEQEVKITFTIDGIEKEVKSVEELQKEMSKLGKETKKAGQENTIFAKAKQQFADFKDGIKGATAGFKGLKGAIAATGIGLLLTAIASLVSYFKNSEEGSRKLAIAMEALGIITGKIMDFFSKLGEMIVWAFTNPKEALMNFVNLIKENIINRFEGLLELIPKLGEAISELFKGNFSNAGKIAADAVGKVALGVENITDKVADATEAVVEFGKTVVAEVKEAVEVATTLVDQFRAIRDEQQRLIVDNANLNKEMETQQKIAEDTNRTYEERKEALELLGEAQVKLAENLARQAKLEEENLKLQIAQESNYEKREELETQLAEATATRIDAETALETRRLDAMRITAELQNEEIARKESINEMIATLNTEAIDNEWERAYAELAIQEQKAMDELDLLNATEAQKQQVRELYAGKRQKLETEESKFNQKLDEMDAKAKMQLASDAFGNIASIVGENSKVGRAAAIAQTTIDTYQSATAAYKSLAGIPVYGPVLGGIAAAAAVASGIANVKSIMSVPIPGGGGGGGGSTPVVNQPPVPNFNPEEALAGGAAADNDVNNEVTLGEQTGSTGPAVVRAYVVSDEMTTQQEADAKITDLARL